MYTESHLIELKEISEFEYWFLQKLLPIGKGDEEESITNIRSDSTSHTLIEMFCEAFRSQATENLISDLRPISILISVKLLDVLFAWILEVNKAILGLTKIPWKFWEKVKLLKNNSTVIVFPHPLSLDNELCNYFIELFQKTVWLRNSMIHSGNYVIDPKGVLIQYEESIGASKKIKYLSNDEIWTLSTLIYELISSVFSGSKPNDIYTINRFKALLDRLSKVHDKILFNTIEPLKWYTFTVPTTITAETNGRIKISGDLLVLWNVLSEKEKVFAEYRKKHSYTGILPEKRGLVLFDVQKPTGQRLQYAIPILDLSIDQPSIELIEGESKWEKYRRL
jgi:hypothetical protein